MSETTPDIVDEVLQYARSLPAPPRAAYAEVGGLVWADLKDRYRPEDAPPENPWAGLPSLPASSLYGVPIYVRQHMDLTAWRIVDRDGNVIREGTL